MASLRSGKKGKGNEPTALETAHGRRGVLTRAPLSARSTYRPGGVLEAENQLPKVAVLVLLCLIYVQERRENGANRS